MSLPKTVRVAGQVVKMLFYQNPLKKGKGLKDEVLLNTLRHELMEASLCISGVGFCETFEQEAVVRCMDEVFFPAYERLLKRLGKHEQKKIT